MKKRGRRAFPALSLEQDVERELQFHLDMRVRELIAEGMDEDAARTCAERAFGNYGGVRNDCQRIAASPTPTRSIPKMLDSMLQDIRFAVRTLQRSPGFLATAVVTLGLGIGANTAIFSVVNGVLLNPLPYPEADRLVVLWERFERGGDNNIASANFFDWQTQSTTFEAMSLAPNYSFGGPTTVLGGDLPVRVYVGRIQPEFFDTMRVLPALGRPFTQADSVEDANPTLVVSHRMWRDLLGAPADLDGIALQIYGTTAPVVGVMPPGFTYPEETDVWIPAGLFGFNSNRTAHNWAAIGRLREGVDIAAARAELDAITHAAKLEFGDDMNAVGVNVYPLIDQLVGSTRRPLMLLLASSGLVLLVACTNLASTLLARGAARSQEIAVRSSMGAQRGRLVRQLVTEATILALAGSVFGVLVGESMLSALRRVSASVPRIEEVGFDPRVAGFAALVALVTVLLCGLLPALRLTRPALADALRGTRGTGSEAHNRIWSSLVVAEVALALMLLIGSGLMIRSLRAVLDVDTGFEATNVLTVEVSLPSVNYPDNEAVGSTLERVLESVRTIAGVESAGLINHLPLGGSNINGGFDLEGAAEQPHGSSSYRVVDSAYFDALGIELIRGRTFRAADTADAEPVVIINKALADRYFAGEDPVGQRIGNLRNDSWIYGDEWMRIVGVVGNVRHRGLTDDVHQEAYVHLLQRPFRARGAVLTLRTTGNPAAIAGSVRARIGAIDDDIPLQFRTMDEWVATSVADRRFTVILLGSFAAVALALSAIGIYGVVSYAVARRTREMGIRLALGAQPGAVRRLVVLGSLRTVILGIAVGTAASLALTGALESLLYEVSPTDPTTFALVVATLFTVAWLASAVPARRSAAVDPMLTMKAE